MAKTSMDQSNAPLLDWLTKQFDGADPALSRSAFREMAQEAERLVPLYLVGRRPLRRAATARKLATLSKNLQRADKAASELGEDGMSQVLLASGCRGDPETAASLRIIADLEDWARWSTQAAGTARLMSESGRDNKGGRTPDARLRSLVTVLMHRFESLLAVKANHTIDPDTGLGRSLFDRFVKEALRLYAPQGAYYGARQVDDAISRALSSRAAHLDSQ